MDKKPRKINDSQSFSSTYWAMRPFWNDCLQLKEPTPSPLGIPGISAYLNKYAKEDPSEFQERVKRLAQVNFVDLIVDAYCAMLFSTNVTIKSEAFEDQVQSFVNSCNQQGDPLVDYFGEVIAPTSLTYGVADVMLDLPTISPDEVSVVQQALAGANTPYCYVIPPLNRVYWKLDAAGNYIEYQSQDIINTQISTAAQIKDQQQYVLWTLDSVATYDGDGDELDTRKNPYGFIPAVTVVPRYPLRYHKEKIGISLVQDVIPNQKLVINLMSLIVDWMENANFAMRVLIQDTSNGDEPPSEGELSEGGNSRGLVLRGKDSDFKIISPDAGGVEAMCRFLDSTIERIFQSVSMPSDANVNKSHTTGNSIRSSQAVLFNKLSKITKHFERAIKNIVDMSLKVQGLDPVAAKVTVQWDRNFSYEALSVALNQLLMLKQAVSDIAPTAVAEYAKSVIAPQLYSTGKMDAIDAEADQYAVRQKAVNETPQPVDGAQQTNPEKLNQQENAANKDAAWEANG